MEIHQGPLAAYDLVVTIDDEYSDLVQAATPETLPNQLAILFEGRWPLV